MVAAMNVEEYDNSAVCGAYVHVIGLQGDITVRIVDLCPECLDGHLDLSQEAFSQIADLPLGRVPITWQVVSPALPGPIAYHFKDGSNQWWTAVQIRNHRNPIARLEYSNSGQSMGECPAYVVQLLCANGSRDGAGSIHISGDRQLRQQFDRQWYPPLGKRHCEWREPVSAGTVKGSVFDSWEIVIPLTSGFRIKPTSLNSPMCSFDHAVKSLFGLGGAGF